MKTILVTGGSGFIGHHLCERLLSHGNHVVCVDIAPSKIIENTNYCFYQLDVNNTDELNEVFECYSFDLVYHLASNTSIPKGQKDLSVDIENTFNTTLSVLNLIAKNKINKFVYFSSSTVYGDCPIPCTEIESHLYPVSYYGAAKLAGEAFVSAFSNLFKIQSWVIRPCNVIGTDAHGVIRDIKKQLTENRQTLHLLGDGTQEKPFIYIEDFLDGLELIISRSHDLYNLFLVGNDTTTSIKRMVEIVQENINSKITVEWSKQPTWPGDVQQYKYNIDKIKSLGWKPKYSSDGAVKLSLI